MDTQNSQEDIQKEWEVLKAAETIKNYCKQNLCYDCPLRFSNCERNLPCNWVLPKEP